MNILMTFFMTMGMTLIMTLVMAGKIQFPGIIYDAMIAFAFAMMANLIFAAGKYGIRFAKKRGASEGTFSYHLWMSLIPAVYNGIIMTAVMTALKIGLNSNFVKAYFSTIWIGVLAGYIISLMIAIPVSHLAEKITNEE